MTQLEAHLQDTYEEIWCLFTVNIYERVDILISNMC